MTNDPGTVPLLVRQNAHVEIDRVIDVLADLRWLGSRLAAPTDRPDLRRISTDLELPIRDGSAAAPLRVATYIDFGDVRPVGDHVHVEIAWHAAIYAPLFPVFAGELRVSPDDLVLDGRYAPPFGALGLLLDRGLLHFVARRTAAALLSRLAGRLES